MRKTIALLLILTVLLSLSVPALAAPQKPVVTGTSPDSFAYLTSVKETMGNFRRGK